jgi:hypothetical protein
MRKISLAVFDADPFSSFLPAPARDAENQSAIRANLLTEIRAVFGTSL